MSTIKVREVFLYAMTFGEDCMVIRGNSTRDKKVQIFHLNSEGFHTSPMYNIIIYNIFIYCSWVVTRWQWLFYM